MVHLRSTWLMLALGCLLLADAGEARAAEAKLIQRSGKGALYEWQGQRIAVLTGTPEEMGRQHGTLLKADVRKLTERVLQFCRGADNYKKQDYFAGTIESAYQRLKPFIPRRFAREMDALADAAKIPRQTVRLANVFPALFHCSGYALMGKATVGGELFHGRVLDYMTDIGLQQFAVTFICLPAGGNAFMNVGFAGFIGSVTGMNEKQLAFGEMGGGGDGKWDGMPMAFLMRKAMEEADTLDEALDLFKKTPRTCEYYYVISDGKTRDAVGIESGPDVFNTVRPGQAHPRLKTPVADTVLLSGGDRYPLLVKRVKEHYGHIDVAAAIALAQRPVSMKSNLHDVVFAPERLTAWIAIATDPIQDEAFQASEQPYVQVPMKRFLQVGRELARQEAEVAPAAETLPSKAPASLSGIGDDAARAAPAPASGAAEATLLKRYLLAPRTFRWSATLKLNATGYALYDLRFPSPVKTEYPADNTVYCEYFRTHKQGKRPAVVVLHILDGRFLVARLVCANLAAAGMDALLVKLPFYGPRRPENADSVLGNPHIFDLLIRQGVADTRRAAALLAGLDTTEKGRTDLCGVSLGGFLGALTAGVDGHFARAAFILAGGGLLDVLHAGSRETRGLAERIVQLGISDEALHSLLAPIDPLTFAHRLKPCDVLMINVDGDEVVPASAAKALAQAAGGKRIQWYEGAKHTALLKYLLDVLARNQRHFQKP